MMRIFLAAMLAGTAVAQVSVPVLGYLPDNGAIRTMYGIPESGSIGPVLQAAQRFNAVAASSSGSFAVASSDTGIAVLTPAPDGVSLQAATIEGAAAGSVQLSPNGTAALVSNGGGIQVIGGLPGIPSVLTSMDVAFLGAASALAVSDDGQWVAGVFGGSVQAINSSGQIVTLPAPAGVTAIAFFHGTNDLAVTTAVQILKISDIGGTPSASSIFGSADTPTPAQSPLALALTADNSRIVLIEPDGGIGQVELASGTVSTANCGCTPQGLNGLGGFLFRLSDLANGSVKIYDAASGEVLFVPLALAGTQGGQQ